MQGANIHTSVGVVNCPAEHEYDVVPPCETKVGELHCTLQEDPCATVPLATQPLVVPAICPVGKEPNVQLFGVQTTDAVALKEPAPQVYTVVPELAV